MLEAFRSSLLVSGLVFPGIAAYIAVYVTLVSMAVFVVGTKKHHVQSPAAMGIFVALVAILISILLNGAAPRDWEALLLVLPFLLALPTASALARTPATVFGGLCLIGALAALGVGMVDIFALGLRRAGGGNNPIHYASLAGMLGMVSLIGVLEAKGRVRYVFLLGPLAAFLTALLSDSRGPLLADCAMYAIALVAFRRDLKFAIALLVFPVAGAVGMVMTGEGQRALMVFSGIFSEATQGSDTQRIMMYRAGWEMFASSPIWGHGFADFMDIARGLYPIEIFDNLHADLANLAAVAGILGLIAYGGLLGAPLLVLIRPAARRDPVLVYLAVVVSIGNAALGLTNSIIGVLPQMTLFVLMLGYVMARERALEPIEARP